MGKTLVRVGVLGSHVSLLLLLALVHRGGAICDNSSEFTCQNDMCIPLTLYNNTVNDCGDNSDEVLAPCRKPAFSCRAHGCITKEWVLDGNADCEDLSDEAKIIGTDCTMVAACCDCDVYVSHSVCQSGVCHCQSGYYSNALGTVCTRRIVGDNCTVDTDCSDAFSNSSCTAGYCTCDTGYYTSADKATCVQNIIGDSCSAAVDCSTVIEYSDCRYNECVCNYGYYPSPDHRTCVRRELGEACRLVSDCAGVTRGTCINYKCTCQVGYRMDDDGMLCHLRHLGNTCSLNEDCAFSVKRSECQDGRCTCNLGYHQGENHYECVVRLIGETCRTRSDCDTSVTYSDCIRRRCVCYHGYLAIEDMTSCQPWPERHSIPLIIFCVAAIAIVSLFIIFFSGLICRYFVITKGSYDVQDHE